MVVSLSSFPCRNAHYAQASEQGLSRDKVLGGYL